jgi:hypothetical protein
MELTKKEDSWLGNNWHDLVIDASQINQSIEFKSPTEYVIDFDRVKTIDDVVAVLKGLNIKYYDYEKNINKDMMYYLKESDGK